jgi:hypothetical protein
MTGMADEGVYPILHPMTHPIWRPMTHPTRRPLQKGPRPSQKGTVRGGGRRRLFT